MLGENDWESVGRFLSHYVISCSWMKKPDGAEKIVKTAHGMGKKNICPTLIGERVKIKVIEVTGRALQKKKKKHPKLHQKRIGIPQR